MGWKNRLADRAADAAATRLRQAKDKVEGESATARLKALIEMRDEQPITIEDLLALLVDAVHADDPPELSRRGVRKAAKRRQRRAGLLGAAGGPVGAQLAALYCEVKVLCDVADRQGLRLTDEELAAHLLVMWKVVDDVATARAAIDGSGASVASHLATGLRERFTRTLDGKMSKRDAVEALGTLRGMARGTSRAGRANAKRIIFSSGHAKATIAEAERVLGIGGSGSRFGRRPQPSVAIGVSAGDHPEGDWEG